MNGRALVDIKDLVRRGDCCAPASCSTALLNCAMTARPNPAAGSSRAASPRRATRWPAATRQTRASRASLQTGRGPGRPTGASSTIAPAPTLPGNPGIPAKPIIEWNGSRWVGIDVPDYGPTTKPSEGVGPFIMNEEGLGRLFALEQMVEGPFPEHYEPFESPVANRPASQGADEPCGTGIRRRQGGVRRCAGLPLCGDDLPT